MKTSKRKRQEMLEKLKGLSKKTKIIIASVVTVVLALGGLSVFLVVENNRVQALAGEYERIEKDLSKTVEHGRDLVKTCEANISVAGKNWCVENQLVQALEVTRKVKESDVELDSFAVASRQVAKAKEVQANLKKAIDASLAALKDDAGKYRADKIDPLVKSVKEKIEQARVAAKQAVNSGLVVSILEKVDANEKALSEIESRLDKENVYLAGLREAEVALQIIVSEAEVDVKTLSGLIGVEDEKQAETVSPANQNNGAKALPRSEGKSKKAAGKPKSKPNSGTPKATPAPSAPQKQAPATSPAAPAPGSKPAPAKKEELREVVEHFEYDLCGGGDSHGNTWKSECP